MNDANGHSKHLTAEQLLSYMRAPVPVSLPELDGVAHVRELTVGEREEFEAEVFAAPADADQHPAAAKRVFVALLVRCLADEHGRRLFRDDQREELSQRLSSGVARQLFDAGCELNALGRHAEELEKN